MFFIAILTFANAVLENKGFVLFYRWKIGDIPLNVIDGLIALGMILCLLRFRSRARFRTDHAHPALRPILITLLITLLVGMVASVTNEARLYEVWIEVRNL